MNSTSCTTASSTASTSTMVGSVPTIVLPNDNNSTTHCPVTMANIINNNNNNLNGKLPKMYNLNVNVNVSAANSAISNFLAVESNCTTPRTPEILNSLMAMSNPLDDFNYNASEKCAVGGLKGGSGNDSASNSSGSPLGSPANGSTPSVQKTCSDLIKAGLKLSIESKRKLSGSDSMDGLPCPKKLKKEEPFISEDEYDDSCSRHKSEELTPEDEERRRRRRERNKIAATKCRLKKRERTVNLVNEAEVLEAQNFDLKAQIQTLQGERQHLANMINHHEQSCAKRGNNNSSPTAPYNPIQPPYESPSSYPISATPYEPNSPYIRPESANILATSYCDLENPPPSNYSQPVVDAIDLPSSYSIPMSEEQHYMRHTNQNSYINGDETFLKSTSNILNIDSPDNEYIVTYENQEINHHQYNEHTSQQCHNMNSGGSRQKFSTGMDNGCMA